MDINPYLEDARRYRTMRRMMWLAEIDSQLVDSIVDAATEKEPEISEGLKKPEDFNVFVDAVEAEFVKQTGEAS